MTCNCSVYCDHIAYATNEIDTNILATQRLAKALSGKGLSLVLSFRTELDIGVVDFCIRADRHW